MTFLNPLFLWFATLSAVPVIIHFLNRTKPKKIRFSTLRFLQPATKRILKRFKFLEWLLLLLRVSILLLLTLSFARPVWKGYVGEKEVFHNIILIDNSYSMGYRLGKGSALELSKEVAVQLIKELDGQFAIGIINNGLTKLYPFTDDRNILINEIHGIKQSAFTTDVLKGVQETISILHSKTEPDIEKNIIVLSDFNKDGFHPAPADRNRVKLNDTQRIKFLLIDTCPGSKNLWINKVAAGTAYSGIPSKINAVINAKNAAKTKVSLVIQDQKRNLKLVEVSESSPVEFNHTFKNPGLYTGWLEIEGSSEYDRIDIDNVCYFQIRVRPRISVLIVDGRPGYTLMGGESYFVTRALSPGNYKTPASARVINPSELKSMKVDEYEVMLLLNVRLDRDMIRIVSDFSSSRGGVGIFLGDNVDCELYNRLLASLMPVEITSLKPQQISREVELKVSGKFKKVFSTSGRIKLGKVIITRGEPVEKPDILADDIPLLWLYSPPGLIRGRQALFTATADMDWTDFPLKSSYPAFIHELVLYLAGDRDDDSNYLSVGQVFPEGTDKNEKIKILSKLPVKQGTKLINTELPGNYVIGRDSEKKVYSVNVNTVQGEPNLEKSNFSSIKKMFGGDTYYIPYSDDLHQEIVKRITGEEKSRFFLIAAFVFLVFEEFLRKYLRSRET